MCPAAVSQTFVLSNLVLIFPIFFALTRHPEEPESKSILISVNLEFLILPGFVRNSPYNIGANSSPLSGDFFCRPFNTCLKAKISFAEWVVSSTVNSKA